MSEAKFAEFISLLKKWVSARSALQVSQKTRPKHYENDVSASEPRVQENAKEFFNRLKYPRKLNFAFTQF